MEMEFHSGDAVRIREWEDMKNEYGIDEYGEIPCNMSFVAEMLPLCGMIFTVEKVTDTGIVRVREEPPELFGRNGDRDDKFIISTDMIERADGDDRQMDCQSILDVMLE